MVWHKPSRSETKPSWPRCSAVSARPCRPVRIGIISHTGKLVGKMRRPRLNGNDRQRPAPALRELYGKPRRSNAWESEGADVIRFWTDDGDSWAFFFHHMTAIHYSARHESLLITWTLGTLVVAGPKVLEFYDDFCNHRATSLTADGTDIRSVRMHLRAKKGVERDEYEITTDDR
jgi:hypothetical protein